MTWTWAAFMPHPPIIVPEVGKGRERDADKTIQGVAELCSHIAEINKTRPPEVLLILSPHEPYVPGALYVNTAEQARGSLTRFGAPSVRFTLNTPKEAVKKLEAAIHTAGIKATFGDLPDITQDHGSLVPLHFLAKTFEHEKLPPVIVASPSGLSPMDAVKLGKALAAMNGQQKPWALLASGDLSHRLKPEGPGGFNSDGSVFDQAVVAALEKGSAKALLELSPAVCENAGECGLRSALVLLALCGQPMQVFSYEGPFGVGYCNALWSPQDDEAKVAAEKNRQPVITGHIVFKPAAPQTAPPDAKGHPYAMLARQTIDALLRGKPLPDNAAAAALGPDPAMWNRHQGCFVSIKNKNGSLRGCIGTFMPTQPDLATEIRVNAVAASTKDPRFKPMQADELDNVRISVDVLNAPELVQEGMELDPAKWGVIVSKGGRRGLLLPDLPSVTTVEQQLAIAAQKGGIHSLDGAEIYRFSVSRHYEDRE